MALYADMKTEYQNFVKYVDEQMMSISDAVDDAVATVEGTQAGAVSAVNSTKDIAVQTINNTATSAVQRVEDAYTDFDTLYQEKTQGLITTANNQIVNIDNAAQENIAKSRTWATGEDVEVEVLEAGEHSSRGYADLAMAIANADEDVPVDASKLVALDTIRGPRGYNGKDGVGIPVGGNIGQALVKKSGTDYEVQWSTLDTLPSQTDNANKFLSTDGTNASWRDIGKTLDTSITNCITEIPQDIKLELNNGTLTLKAGSKLYQPNGVGVFTEINITSDKTRVGGLANEQTMFFWDVLANGIRSRVLDEMISGTTAPTKFVRGVTWYDTTENKIKFYNGSIVESSGGCFPLCICSSDSSGTITSIDQVFNGFGYIGSTVFALPGVKGLIPNGRNADGSLKNIECTLSRVSTTDAHNSKYVLNNVGVAPASYTNYAEQEEQPSFVNGIWYQPSTNIIHRIANSNVMADSLLYAFDLTASGGKATDIKPKTPFRAVDRNDSSWIAQQAMPSGKYIDLTLGASGSSYTAPANGWLFLDKSAVSGQYIEFIVKNSDKNSLGYYKFTHAIGNQSIQLLVPIEKGRICDVNYTATGITHAYRFIYAEGEN